ncbi:MAG: peptidoglycan-binding protein [Sulfuricella sp.]|jgi:peptidoglycan L-alanyl-D-glutamate endopeptidase CwlK
MNTLRPGSSGDEVKLLQSRLAELGFPPGKIDGDFGPGTEAAVRAFQHSRMLLADGIAGPRTLAALGLVSDAALPSAIPQVTVEKTCVMFPYTPRKNIEKYLPAVLQGLVEAELQEKPMVLMALASIRAETEGFVPISEGKSRFNTSPGGKPFDLYDNRADIGNSQPGDGARYCGRGFIQLTGKANYRQHGRAIGLGDDLINNPELANDPLIAARLLCSFIKAKERAIKEALMEHDLRHARRLVNGGSHGLDRFTDCYQRGQALLKDV